MREITTIELKAGTWEELNQRKDRGESFDDVVTALLEEADE